MNEQAKQPPVQVSADDVQRPGESRADTNLSSTSTPEATRQALRTEDTDDLSQGNDLSTDEGEEEIDHI